MKLPRYKQAIISRQKIVDYLLSITHPWGKHKAEWFVAFGFSSENWGTLAEALRRHAADHEVAKIEATPFGNRYVVDGIMEMPNGLSRRVRVVWFVEEGDEAPQFVTAYPLKGK